MPSLIDLSVELQLKIAEDLLNGNECQDEDTKKQENNVKLNGDTTRIQVDLVHWSCTSSYFRHLLAPYIFKTIRLCNEEKSGVSVTALAKCPYSEYVKELHFIGSAPGDAKCKEEAFSDTVAIFPKSVDALLSDLRQFPNLETLSVEFAYRFDDYKEWDEGLDLCAEEETDEEVEIAEKGIAWRALMLKTYEALTKNREHHLKTLEVRQLVPKKVSIWKSQTFHDLLSRVERFRLSIYGEDNGAGWKINKIEDYCSIMSKLDEFFFDHLKSVTHLIIEAPAEGPIGLEGMNHIPLALKKEQMPLLKSLHLELIFICPELVSFLLSHSKTLEHLSLTNCYAGIGGLAENGIHWEELLDPLCDADLKKLRQIHILPEDLPLSEGEVYPHLVKDEEVSDEVREARRILEADPGRRLFGHAMLDDKYGMILQNEWENLASFQQGEDQRSYDRLVRKVNANNAQSFDAAVDNKSMQG
ncbi:hypothetical protein P7C71_g4862, partial [Lecanoromycetidae sp. Uapishka_2]